METFDDERVLILLPTAKDAERTARVLDSEKINYFICRDLKQLCLELKTGAAAALLTEEALDPSASEELRHILKYQPTWSDLPLVVLAREQVREQISQEALNVTLVERPIKVRSLLSVIRTALRSRRRQYEVRDHLAERQQSEEALREAESELRQSDRKKDEFIALLAHELRNPLAPIRNGLQVLKLSGNDSALAVRAREMMERQLTHMVRLVDDLLDVSRISRNKMELRCEKVLLADIIESALETSRPAIDAGGHKLSVSLPDQKIFLNADVTRLAQVFSNLLTNSAKYTERGGNIRIAAECTSSEVIVSVQDNGIGIPAESLDNIFDMFSQVERTFERTAGGLGIGLALVKALSEAHGGSVTAKSEGRGTGSRFAVTLPIFAEREEPVPIPSNGQSHHAPSRRILVVDDSVDGAESLTMMLKLLGNEVHIACDGVEALEMAEKFRPDVILMDVGMPRLNGYDATKYIREHVWGKDISIIALTGWGQENDRERSRRAGCNGHLVKPVNLPDLERALGELATVRTSPLQAVG